ncbi:hypothetical protein ABIF86_000309 [Bradyrhizobium japonicum]
MRITPSMLFIFTCILLEGDTLRIHLELRNWFMLKTADGIDSSYQGCCACAIELANVSWDVANGEPDPTLSLGSIRR